MLEDPLDIDSSFQLSGNQIAVSRGDGKSVYSGGWGSYRVQTTIQHSESNGRRRSNVKMDINALAGSPFDDNQNVDNKTTISLVIDRHLLLTTDGDVATFLKEYFGVLFPSITETTVDMDRLERIVAGES
jgi:hypothetical protein